MWTKKDRFLAVLEGQLADRPPVSGWRHFTDTEHGTPQEFANSMLDFHHKYDWDYMKLQPRATYYEEAWGGEFDYSDYKGGVVAPCTKSPIRGVEDLEKIVELSGNHSTFGEQLEAVKLIQNGIKDDAPIFQTMMCPTSVFQKLFAIDAIGRYRAASRDDMMVTLMHERPELVHRALKNITRTLANYSQELIKIGTFGVFYGATGLSRTGYLTTQEWEEFVKPYDLELMESLKPCKIMVHACGMECNPERFAHYPISILHWPESATGNIALNTAPQWLGKITPMGGV
ncbi:MAG: uroporphyrinogen decarboxylase family protein, partial [Oscillospiraceae bacterium]